MDSNTTDDISTLIDELKNTKNFMHCAVPPSQDVATVAPALTEDNVEAFIYEKSAKLIQQGLDVMESLKLTMLSSGKADEIESYSKLMTAVTGSIEIVNKVNLQKRKEKNTKELRMLDYDEKKNLSGGQTAGTINNNQITIVATREEMMERLMEQVNGKSTPHTVEKPAEVIEA